MMGWKCYTGNTVAPGAPTDETQALDYRVEWTLNNPATVTVAVNDDSGTKSQTYGTGYLGKSYLALEQPTATQIFRGRIVAAEPNPRDGLLMLTGEDWLGQLNDRVVIFDTREDLGNGYREDVAEAFNKSATECQAFWVAGGPVTTLDVVSTRTGLWPVHNFQGFKLAFPTKHMGSQTDTCYAYDEAAAAFVPPMTTDTPADGETYTWTADGTNYHNLSKTSAGGDCGFAVNYSFRTRAKESTCVASIDSLQVTLVWRCASLGTVGYNGWAIMMYDYVSAAYLTHLFGTSAHSTWTTTTVTIPANTFTRYIDANGYMRVQIYVQGSTGTSTVYVDQIYVTVKYTVDTADTTLRTIFDSGGAAGENQASFAADITVDGMINWWPYSVVQPLTVHVANLVTTYDVLFALDAATDLTASTNYVGRHYHRVVPLGILRDLAKVDGTDFWLDSAYHLHWNDAYNVAGAPTWTDSSVLDWEPAGIRLKDVINESFVEGYTQQTWKIAGTYSDAGSIASYGQRSEYVSNADICRNDEAFTEATNRVKRRKDPPIHVTALLNGYSTKNLGEVIVVNSSKLGIASVNYVIARKVYDSGSATTTCDLVPRPAASPYQVNPRIPLSQLMAKVDERISQLEDRLERGARYTEVWT
jgi:hypothetical protein